MKLEQNKNKTIFCSISYNDYDYTWNAPQDIIENARANHLLLTQNNLVMRNSRVFINDMANEHSIVNVMDGSNSRCTVRKSWQKPTL